MMVPKKGICTMKRLHKYCKFHAHMQLQYSMRSAFVSPVAIPEFAMKTHHRKNVHRGLQQRTITKGEIRRRQGPTRVRDRELTLATGELIWSARAHKQCPFHVWPLAVSSFPAEAGGG